MPANLTGLQAEIDALVAQAAATEGTEASATLFINNFAAATTKAVADALAADNAADDASIAVATAAIETQRARFAASAKPLGEAIAANPGTPPPVTT